MFQIKAAFLDKNETIILSENVLFLFYRKCSSMHARPVGDSVTGLCQYHLHIKAFLFNAACYEQMMR